MVTNLGIFKNKIINGTIKIVYKRMYWFYSRSRLFSLAYTAVERVLRAEIASYARLVLSEPLIRSLKVWCIDLDK